jgi:hypothetical protein
MSRSRIFWVLALLFIFSGCSENMNQSNVVNTSLSQFMIGRWSASRQTSNVYENYEEKFFIQFYRDGTMKYCHIDPIEPICTNFDYELISGDLYSLKNQRIEEEKWFIDRDEDKLHICFQANTDCLDFVRDDSLLNVVLEYFGVYR